MDRVFLKPTHKEIVIKGNSKEGHTDVFAYDYYDSHSDEDRAKLGGLYIIGNVKQDETANLPADEVKDSPDIAYVINLIASLAKREYYSRPELSPRDAFSATLKKINDVVEEFFSAKGGSTYGGGRGLKINVGIFAITGEQILISKLGKFKIILGRDSRVIDILNNIDLFSKEGAVEKEFSGIVSGKVMPGDKLFAFYPNRMVTARERTFKAALVKFDAEQFVERIGSVRETRPDFDCGALYLSLNKHKESAKAKQPRPITDAPPETPPLSQVRLASDENKNKNKSEIIAAPEAAEEVPRIISSEFSLGRKTNPLFTSLIASIKMIKGLYIHNVSVKRKFVVLGLVAGVFVVGVIALKSFIIINPEQRQLNTAINQAQNNLKLVRTKVGQNDLIGARQLLAQSLANIRSVGITGDKTNKTAGEILAVLDGIDKAVNVSPSPVEIMPEEVNQKIAILNNRTQTGSIASDVYENNLYILTPDSIMKIADVSQAGNKEPVAWLKSGTLPSQSIAIAVDGNVYVMNGSGTLATYYKGERVLETNTFIVSGQGDALLTSKNSDKIYLVNKALARVYELDKKSGSLIKTLTIDSSEPFVNAYLKGDDAIIVTTKDNRIWEIR